MLFLFMEYIVSVQVTTERLYRVMADCVEDAKSKVEDLEDSGELWTKDYIIADEGINDYLYTRLRSEDDNFETLLEFYYSIGAFSINVIE